MSELVTQKWREPTAEPLWTSRPAKCDTAISWITLAVALIEARIRPESSSVDGQFSEPRRTLMGCHRDSGGKSLAQAH